MENPENHTSPELLVELINQEINRLDNYSTRSGINPWILLAALAAIVWIIFPELYNFSESYLALALPFLTLYVFYDFITIIITILNHGNFGSSSNIDRFQYTNINIGGSRHRILFELVKVAVVIILVSSLSNIYNQSGLYILYIPYIFIALILTILFILSFFKIPIIFEGSKSKIAGILFELVVLLSLAIGTSFLVWISINNPPNMISWKISGSLLVISILVGFLSNYSRLNNPLLNSLINLRRDIILNKISLESAIKQADIIFSGLSISHLLQNDVDKLIEKQREISSIYHAIANEYEATKNAALNNPDDKCTLCSSLTRSVNSYAKDAKSLILDYKKKYNKFAFRSSILLSMSSSTDSSIELKGLIEKIGQNWAHTSESLNLVEVKIEAFKKDLNCTEEIKQITDC